MKKNLFLIIFVTVLFTAALFAEGEMSEAVPQQDAASSEEAKPEENAKPENEPAAEVEAVLQEERKSEENKEEQHSGGVTVTEKEISGKNIVNTDIKKVFSGRSTEKMTWDEAVKYCDRFTDFHFGEKWRLPTVDELRELVRNCPATEPGGSCKVSEEENCLAGNCSSPKNSCACERKPKNRGHYSMFGDADYIGLWSGSSLSDDDNKAWGAVFYSGMIGSVSKESKLYARCIARSDWYYFEEDEKDADKDEKKDEKEKKADKEDNFPISEKDINKQFDDKMKDFSFCIYKGMQEDSDMKHGRVTVEYIVSPEGKVLYSGVYMSTFGNLTVENCIAAGVREMKFPAPKHGKKVSLAHSILLHLRK